MPHTSAGGRADATATLPPFVRPRDLADFLGLTRRTIYAMIYDGRLPAPLRLGGRSLRWSREAIAAFLAAQEDASRAG